MYAMLADGRSPAAQWSFLTTRSQTELEPILVAYGQAVDKKKNPLDPTGPLNHTLRVFLIDPKGVITRLELRGAALDQTLAKLLKSPQASRPLDRPRR